MVKSMGKAKIIEKLANESGLTKNDVAKVLKNFTALAYKEMRNSFNIPGIGKLTLVDRKARVGRNPATGEAIHIPARKVLKFRIAKACKDAVLRKKA